MSTTTTRRSLPAAAIGLGIAGLIPFIGLGIGAQAMRDVARAQLYLLALVGYGAVTLAFVGAVHWGFVLQEPATEAVWAPAPPARREGSGRLALGVLPAVIGWAAVVVMLFGIPAVSLAILIVGFIATVTTEAQLARRGLMPPGYMALRWGLSIVVVVVLVTVLALRLIGARIVF
jgi:hypothetical protein